MANENDAKAKTFALIIKFGHDLFEKKDMQSAAASAVNDSHILLGFRSSALYRLHDNKKINVLGQFAQAEINEHSAAVLAQKELIKNTEFNAQGFAVIEKDKLPAALSENEASFLICKLLPPASTHLEGAYIWVLEYEKEITSNVITMAQLLGRSIAEALSLTESSTTIKRWKFSRIAGIFFKIIIPLLLLAAAMFIPVQESTTAEFMLKAPEITAAYSKFDGNIAQCLKQDGEYVKKGEVIARFDTAELQYRLANAQSALKEAEADLELAQQNAFTDEKNLGKIKLMQARCKILEVSVKEAKWFLQNSEIKSPADGILVLTDERAEQLIGKSVRIGDKLFDIYGGKGMIAEVMVNERDSSILQTSFNSELFLHTAPEKGLLGEIVSVSQYPILNEQKSYCYPIRIKLAENEKSQLRFGMRGIAKLSGAKVRLGYYLFKNIILYFRNW